MRAYRCDQLWSYASDDGEEWLLARVASPRNKSVSVIPLLRKPAELLASAAYSIKVDWGARQDLNLRPPGSEPGDLSD